MAEPTLPTSRPKSKSMGAVRKTILRNVEVPKSGETSTQPPTSRPPNVRVIKAHEEQPDQRIRASAISAQLQRLAIGDRTAHSSTTAPKNGKFHRPELNTALGLSRKIHATKNVKHRKSKNSACSSAAAQAIAKEKLTKKLNFPLDENVYKGLTPINVNDSVLIPPVKRPLKSTFVSHSKKDPEPVLADFLEPMKPFSFDLKVTRPTENFQKPQTSTLNNVQCLFELFEGFD